MNMQYQIFHNFILQVMLNLILSSVLQGRSKVPLPPLIEFARNHEFILRIAYTYIPSLLRSSPDLIAAGPRW